MAIKEYQPRHGCFSLVVVTLLLLRNITCGEFTAIEGNHSEDELLTWVKAVWKRDHTLCDKVED